jgi:hypothetical protein
MQLIGNEQARVKALSGLAGHLKGDQWNEALKEALKAAKAIDDTGVCKHPSVGQDRDGLYQDAGFHDPRELLQEHSHARIAGPAQPMPAYE